jgi:hypothetical protein
MSRLTPEVMIELFTFPRGIREDIDAADRAIKGICVQFRVHLANKKGICICCKSLYGQE